MKRKIGGRINIPANLARRRGNIKTPSQAQELCSGVFWIISDSFDLTGHKLLAFKIPCDAYGNPAGTHTVELNAKSGGTYNHKALWESEIKNNSAHKPYNKKDYNYYPRGRVEISNNKAVIYLNPIICQTSILEEIKAAFGLSVDTIPNTKVIADNSAHYACFVG